MGCLFGFLRGGRVILTGKLHVGLFLFACFCLLLCTITNNFEKKHGLGQASGSFKTSNAKKITSLLFFVLRAVRPWTNKFACHQPLNKT